LLLFGDAALYLLIGFSIFTHCSCKGGAISAKHSSGAAGIMPVPEPTHTAASAMRGELYRMQPPHVEEEVLERYAMGGLSAELLPALEDHLLSCSACQSRLMETDEFIRSFRIAASDLGEMNAVPFWKQIFRFYPARWAVAAVLLTMSLAFVGVLRRGVHAPAAIVVMQSLRGPDRGAHIPAGEPAVLIFDLAAPAAGSCRLQIVDPVGKKVQETGTSLREGRLAASVGGLARGDYWVRLYRVGNNELLAEYSLRAD
jgi:hypothetical protein